MNKKGFTLVEMIAVIVIISLIALISVVTITNVLNNSKKKLYSNQVEMIESSARMWASDNLLILPNDNTSTNVCEYANIDSCQDDYKKLIITLKDLQDGGYIGKDIKNPENNKPIKSATIEIEKKEKKLYYTVIVGEDINYREYILNGSDPVLASDMVPVTIDNDGIVKKADLTKEWYKYEDKEWANAVVLVDSTSYTEGDTIPENKIKAYYVWIPRYRYQLFSNTTESTINIEFESNYTHKSSSSTVGQYYTHPAFTYGDEEIKGFWVGKFETTGDATTPTIKPNVSSLRSQNVSTQYATAQNVSNYARMMKNDEWGAVAYLSHSAYGINKQVRINNNSGYKTGCGADTDDKAASSTCDIEYGKVTEYPQSTTGNITGIFDMSGGAWEYVMGVLADSEGKPYSGRHNLYNSDFNGKFGCPTCDSSTSGVDSTKLELTTGTSFPNAKYYNLYTTTNPLTACNGKSCLGHAEAETRGWYGDYYYFPSATSPWVIRGGRCSNGASAGVFNAGSDGGHAISNNSFRVVVPQL